MHYQVFRLKDKNSNRPLLIIETIKSLLVDKESTDNKLKNFGVFQAYFGMATNELYWVVMCEKLNENLNGILTSNGISIISVHNFEPTVRPTTDETPTQDGLYVFRWFSIDNKDVSEIASLSETAWQTFESGFDTEVQALFAESNRESEQGTMLLMTWYKGFDVWLDSRAPDAAARENFLKRHALMREALPIATQRLEV